ncbi:DUF6891 domain-containing protein [Micromonospora coerulea]|uniref:DUF6891 domain-containing protein n=1 Tax=Micromonospora coerulea TaxID=47856 RepID=UPI003558158A
MDRRTSSPRENIRCCGTCAAVVIHDERDDSRHWHGYLWYQQQDTEWLLASEDGEVYLGYGAYPPADFHEVAYAPLPDVEQQTRYQAYLERLLDEIAFPVLRKCLGTRQRRPGPVPPSSAGPRRLPRTARCLRAPSPHRHINGTARVSRTSNLGQPSLRGHGGQARAYTDNARPQCDNSGVDP